MNWRKCGIIGFGSYLPRFRISANVLSLGHGQLDPSSSMKSVSFADEDATTMAIEASRRALLSAAVSNAEIDAVWVGTESKPYAVKTIASSVAGAVGLQPWISAVDLEFACRSGIEAILRLSASVESGAFRYALVVASDAAQGSPGDELEVTAGAAAVAFVLGPADHCPFVISESVTYVTDTLDFFRRDGSEFPTHSGRFTGDPSYFHHIYQAVSEFFRRTSTSPSDYRYAVFHQPNEKFPPRIAVQLGFCEEQIRPLLFAGQIGNPYAANSPLGLSKALAISGVGDRILVASYGSGAGADCFAVEVRSAFSARPGTFDDPTCGGVEITDYAEYLTMTGQLLRGSP